jgi:hypothetical protein
VLEVNVRYTLIKISIIIIISSSSSSSTTFISDHQGKRTKQNVFLFAGKVAESHLVLTSKALMKILGPTCLVIQTSAIILQFCHIGELC